MRTLMLTLACVARMVSHAQDSELIPIGPGNTTSRDYFLRCAQTWGNTKPYMSIDTVERWCSDMIEWYGDADTAYIELMSVFTNEDLGSVSDTSDEGHGYANVHRGHLYQDYRNHRDKNPDFVDFPFEALDDPMNIRFTLILINWHFGPYNPYDYKNREELTMGWNTGYEGLVSLKQRGEEYLQRHYAFREIHYFLANSGIAHSL